MESFKLLFLLSLMGLITVHAGKLSSGQYGQYTVQCAVITSTSLCDLHSGLMRDSDPGEPLTPEDFEYAASEEFQKEISNEDTHDEDESSTLFEGDIEVSDKEQRQALMERGVPGLREVSDSHDAMGCPSSSQWILLPLVHRLLKPKSGRRVMMGL